LGTLRFEKGKGQKLLFEIRATCLRVPMGRQGHNHSGRCAKDPRPMAHSLRDTLISPGSVS
jgi:hypothetical protein